MNKHTELSVSPVQQAFSLVEVAIALGVGAFVILTAYGAIRSVARTIKAADRLALQDRVLRAGYMYAMNEIDYWTLYDDPDGDPAGWTQGLRRTASTLPMASNTFNEREYGLPFTPLKELFPQNEFLRSSSGTDADFDGVVDPDARGWSLRPEERVLQTPAGLTDYRLAVSGSAMRVADHDRGWDMHRPYQANDPANWYQGSVMESSLGMRAFGRYGLFTNQTAAPLLGYGDEARDPGWRGEDVATNGNNGYPGLIKYSGPFGRLSRDESRTFTRYENKILYLWESLGNYASLDYLPANTIYGLHGEFFPWKASDWGSRVDAPYNELDVLAGTYGFPTNPYGAAVPTVAVRVDEAGDLRFSGITESDWNWHRGGSDRFGPSSRGSRGKPQNSTMTQITGGDVVAVIPQSPFSGADVNGYHIDASYDGDNGSLPGSALTNKQKVWRDRFVYSSFGHLFASIYTNNRIMQTVPLLPERPQDWPELQLSVARLFTNGRRLNSCFIRYKDQSTGESVELELTATGTTLRGARQQRHRDGGWAIFYGVDYITDSTDPKFGQLIDGPTPAGPFNDPTLDYPPEYDHDNDPSTPPMCPVPAWRRP